MTIDAGLAFVKILAKEIRRRFPSAWLDEIIGELDEVTHSPAYYKSRIQYFQEKWKEMKDSIGLSSDSEEVKAILRDATMEYEAYGYNLNSLYRMPDAFKCFDISDWNTLSLAGQEYAKSVSENDMVSESVGDIEVDSNVEDLPVDMDETGFFEYLWEVIVDFFN